MRAFFAWCVEEELIEKSPAARLSLPKLPRRVIRTFAPEQIEQLLAVCDVTTGQGFRDYVILVLLLDTGMRVSELVDLRMGNVHARHVKVLRKGFKEREIGMHPDVSKLLWLYMEKYRRSEEYPEEDRVFLGRKGALTTEGIEQVFQRAARASGIKGVRVTPHTMRHTFSKRYLKNGGDLFRLSRELGHSDVQVTGRVYLGDFMSSDAREMYSPIAGLEILKRVRDGRRQKQNRERVGDVCGDTVGSIRNTRISSASLVWKNRKHPRKGEFSDGGHNFCWLYRPIASNGGASARKRKSAKIRKS
jgi:integrase/recombinase XerD